MQSKTKEIMMYVLGLFVVLCSVAVVVLLIFYPIPTVNKDIVNIALGALLGMAVNVIGYFYGSSKGSADKSEDIRVTAEKLAEKIAPATGTPPRIP